MFKIQTGLQNLVTRLQFGMDCNTTVLDSLGIPLKKCLCARNFEAGKEFATRFSGKNEKVRQFTQTEQLFRTKGVCLTEKSYGLV